MQGLSSASALLLLATSVVGCVGPWGDDPWAGEAAAGRTDAPAGPGPWSDEASLGERLDTTILPRYQSGTNGTFVGAAGVEIHWVAFPAEDEQAALVILNGRTESQVEYAEVVDDLSRLGWSVYLMDHRGQGLSGRLLDDRQRGFVDDFGAYVDDVDTFLNQIVGVTPGRPLHGLGHSMGGAILGRYAVEHPSVFSAIVLSSPMLEMDFGDSSESTVYGMAVTLWNGWYASGQGPYDPARPFEDNDLTHSLARWTMQKRINEELYPAIQLGGVTWGWLVESIEATRALREDAGRLSTPTLLLSAEQDTVVSTQAQAAFCAAAASCQLRVLPGARHELLMETDAIRGQALDEIVRFVTESRPTEP